MKRNSVKKAFILTVALATAMSLAACGKKETEISNPSKLGGEGTKAPAATTTPVNSSQKNGVSIENKGCYRQRVYI